MSSRLAALSLYCSCECKEKHLPSAIILTCAPSLSLSLSILLDVFVCVWWINGKIMKFYCRLNRRWYGPIMHLRYFVRLSCLRFRTQCEFVRLWDPLHLVYDAIKRYVHTSYILSNEMIFALHICVWNYEQITFSPLTKKKKTLRVWVLPKHRVNATRVKSQNIHIYTKVHLSQSPDGFLVPQMFTAISGRRTSLVGIQLFPLGVEV